MIMATNYSPETKHILKWLENNVKDYVTYDDAKIMPGMRAGFDVKRFMRDVKKEIADEPDMVSIDKACDAYCKVCGHFPHTVPIHICRHDCVYFSDFKNYIKDEGNNKK